MSNNTPLLHRQYAFNFSYDPPIIARQPAFNNDYNNNINLNYEVNLDNDIVFKSIPLFLDNENETKDTETKDTETKDTEIKDTETK
jgi:hypothetical protein